MLEKILHMHACMHTNMSFGCIWVKFLEEKIENECVGKCDVLEGKCIGEHDIFFIVF